MTTTINGRTLEEIKARIDFCRNVKTARDCISCPYGEDADVCASDFMFDSFDYMQHLETELAEARKDVDMLGEQVAALDGAYNAMKRERDAAVDRCVNADDVSAGYYHEIKQLEAAQPKWISVEKCKPKTAEFVLLKYAKNAQNPTMHARNTMAVGRYEYGMFLVEGCSVKVTHWMPLPSTEGLDAT